MDLHGPLALQAIPTATSGAGFFVFVISTNWYYPQEFCLLQQWIESWLGLWGDCVLYSPMDERWDVEVNKLCLFDLRKSWQSYIDHPFCTGSTGRGLSGWQGWRQRRTDRAWHCLHLSRLQVLSFRRPVTVGVLFTQFPLAGQQSEGSTSMVNWCLVDNAELYLHVRWQSKLLLDSCEITNVPVKV